MENVEIKYLNVCKLYVDEDDLMINVIVIDDCDGDDDEMKNTKDQLQSCFEVLDAGVIEEMHQYLINTGYSTVGIKIGRVSDDENAAIGVTTIKFEPERFEADCKLIELYVGEDFPLSRASAMATGMLYLLALGGTTDHVDEAALMSAASELGLCKL